MRLFNLVVLAATLAACQPAGGAPELTAAPPVAADVGTDSLAVAAPTTAPAGTGEVPGAPSTSTTATTGTTSTTRPAPPAAAPAVLQTSPPAAPTDEPTAINPRPASGRTWHVAAGAAAGGDGSRSRPFATVAAGLAAAEPGETVAAGPGLYRESLVTVRSGRADAPIRLVGDGARIVGDGRGRLVQILHSFVTLERFDLSGADILVWVQGATGVRILGSVLHDAGSECVRIKFFSVANEVGGNRIFDCGRRDFDLAAGRKNGEGIYIGTAPEQLGKNPRPEPDASNRNWVHDNVLSLPAECVDVKEAATGNVIERNVCSGGRDPDGAGFSSRGVGTVFAANASTGQTGAGIRLGGDGEGDGILSIVRNNRLVGNQGYGLKVQRLPQGVTCGNEIAGNQAGVTNGPLDPTAPC